MITQERLKQLFHYDPDTGVVTRRVKVSNQLAGSLVGSPNADGYLAVRVDGSSYMLHRLIVLYVTGEMPACRVDHQDHDGCNNRWSNIRDATPAQNAANARQVKKTASGVKGVQLRVNGRWVARICVDGKAKHLGYFATCAEAKAAYDIAAVKAFGEFACFG